jgi:hypothetical protein
MENLTKIARCLPNLKFKAFNGFEYISQFPDLQNLDSDLPSNFQSLVSGAIDVKPCFIDFIDNVKNCAENLSSCCVALL